MQLPILLRNYPLIPYPQHRSQAVLQRLPWITPTIHKLPAAARAMARFPIFVPTVSRSGGLAGHSPGIFSTTLLKVQAHARDFSVGRSRRSCTVVLIRLPQSSCKGQTGIIIVLLFRFRLRLAAPSTTASIGSARSRARQRNLNTSPSLSY